jgi:hypothetical protein
LRALPAGPRGAAAKGRLTMTGWRPAPQLQPPRNATRLRVRPAGRDFVEVEWVALTSPRAGGYVISGTATFAQLAFWAEHGHPPGDLELEAEPLKQHVAALRAGIEALKAEMLGLKADALHLDFGRPEEIGETVERWLRE